MEQTCNYVFAQNLIHILTAVQFLMCWLAEVESPIPTLTRRPEGGIYLGELLMDGAVLRAKACTSYIGCCENCTTCLTDCPDPDSTAASPYFIGVCSEGMNLIQCSARLAAEEADFMFLGGSDVKGEETLMATEIVRTSVVSCETNVFVSERNRR